MTSRIENRSVPTIWLKTVPNQTKTALFWIFGWGTVDIEMRRHFFGWDCSLDAELQTCISFFKIPPTGRVLWPSLQAFGIGPAKSWDFDGSAPQK